MGLASNRRKQRRAKQGAEVRAAHTGPVRALADMLRSKQERLASSGKHGASHLERPRLGRPAGQMTPLGTASPPQSCYRRRRHRASRTPRSRTPP